MHVRKYWSGYFCLLHPYDTYIACIHCPELRYTRELTPTHDMFFRPACIMQCWNPIKFKRTRLLTKLHPVLHVEHNKVR